MNTKRAWYRAGDVPLCKQRLTATRKAIASGKPGVDLTLEVVAVRGALDQERRSARPRVRLLAALRQFLKDHQEPGEL